MHTVPEPTPNPQSSFSRSARLSVVLYAGLSLGGIAQGKNWNFLLIPEQDRSILATVAQEYGLRGDSRKLLFSIYLAERGYPGCEMGVCLPRAQRYKGDHAKSLRLQACYAAGTIRKRFTNDLEAFAARWCPLNDPRDRKGLNRFWLGNVRIFMQ